MNAPKEKERRGLALAGFLWSLIYYLGSEHEIKMSLVNQILENHSGEWLFYGRKGLLVLKKKRGAYSLEEPTGSPSEDRQFRQIVNALRAQLQALLGPDDTTPNSQRRKSLLPDPTRVNEYKLYAHALSSAIAA